MRLPIGDWMFRPYGIYDVVQHGVRCNDGAPPQGPSTIVQTKLGLILEVTLPTGPYPSTSPDHTRSHPIEGAARRAL